MCVPCEASKARLMASTMLRERIEEEHSLAPVLRAAFPPPRPSDELLRLVKQFAD